MAAIYQWYTDGGIVYTTTPYPIEGIEGLQMSSGLEAGSMVDMPVLEESGNVDADLHEIVWRSIVITGPTPPDETGTIDADLSQIVWRNIIIPGPTPPDETGTIDADLYAIVWRDLRIEILTWPEALEMTSELEPTYCDMTEV